MIRRTIPLVLCASLLAGLSSQALLAADYLLNKQDELLVRVLRWNPDTGEFTELDGVSGQFRISQDGHVSFPLIGRMEAAGKTASQVADQLTGALDDILGLSAPPRIGLEVVGHMPVYVLGAVSSPGAYGYHPGLTAQQALALSGGLQRTPLPQNGSNTDTIMRIGGEIRLLSGELAARIAERQRLTTDLASLSGGEDGPDTLHDLTPPEGLEADILEADQGARVAQGERIRDLQEVLSEQIQRLTAQIELREEQILLTQDELDGVSSLKERGLAVNARVSALTSNLNDLEAKRLELEIARLTARQQLNRAQRDELQLVDTARADMLQDLNKVERDINGLQTRLATARSLREQAVSSGVALPDTAGALETRFQVTRDIGGVAETSFISATDPLLPGDTLEILRVEPELDGT